MERIRNVFRTCTLTGNYTKKKDTHHDNSILKLNTQKRIRVSSLFCHILKQLWYYIRDQLRSIMLMLKLKQLLTVWQKTKTVTHLDNKMADKQITDSFTKNIKLYNFGFFLLIWRFYFVYWKEYTTKHGIRLVS